jgi:hypothetical protein
LALKPISKMTNGLVEIGLISITVILAIAGFSIWVVAIMVGVSASWWGIVHHRRFANLVSATPAKAIGSLVVALLVMGFAHLVGFGLGGAFHAILGLK